MTFFVQSNLLILYLLTYMRSLLTRRLVLTNLFQQSLTSYRNSEIIYNLIKKLRNVLRMNIQHLLHLITNRIRLRNVSTTKFINGMNVYIL